MSPAVINITGDIDESTTRAVMDGIKAAKNRPIHVVINSPGGSVVSGLEALAALRAHKPGVTTEARGLAASMASVLLMAGSVRRIAEDTLVMVHEVWMTTTGPADAHLRGAKELEALTRQLGAIYASRCNKSLDEILALMAAETWMDAPRAVAMGFADEIIQPEKSKAKSNVILPPAPPSIPTEWKQASEDYERLPAVARVRLPPKPPTKCPAQVNPETFNYVWDRFTRAVRNARKSL